MAKKRKVAEVNEAPKKVSSDQVSVDDIIQLNRYLKESVVEFLTDTIKTVNEMFERAEVLLKETLTNNGEES